MPKPSQSAKSTRLAQLFFLVLIALLARLGSAQRIDWRTGKEFQERLRAPVGITWDEQPLREGLQKLAVAERMAIFLDRRSNPNQRISISLDDVPLETALRRIARQVQFGVGFAGPVIYVGPPLTCSRIATVATVRNDQVKQLPAASQRRLLRRSRLGWEDLTEPRLLIASTASSAGLTIPNVRSVPHDLWFGSDLPPMTFGEKATLLLAGFDMSFRFHENASQIYLTRFPRAVTLERSYRSSKPEKLAELLQAEFPQAFVALKEDGKTITVQTTLEDHWKIRRIQSGQPSGTSQRPPEKRYSIKVENKPVGPLLRLLAKKLRMRIEFSKSVDNGLKKRLVSASVKEATPMELMSAMAEPAGLKVQIAAGVIYISNP